MKGTLVTFGIVVSVGLILSCTTKPTQPPTQEEFCKALAEEIRIYFDQLNTCKTDSDCVLGYGICPLGPYFLFNKMKVDSFQLLLAKYQEKCPECTYKISPPPTKRICVKCKCVSE